MSRRHGQGRQFGNGLVNYADYYNYYAQYFRRLAVSRANWSGLPDTINADYMERQLFYRPIAVFKDEVIGWLALPFSQIGNRDVYGDPVSIMAVGDNGYTHQLKPGEFFILWPARSREAPATRCDLFARRLSTVDRIIGVNVYAQKTPVVVVAPKEKIFSYKNAMIAIDGDIPVIEAYEGFNVDGSGEGVKSINTQAPYHGRELYELKTQYFNEALTYLGIPNVTMQKKERVISDEVNRALGGVYMSQADFSYPRSQLVEFFSQFGYDVKYSFNDGEEVGTSEPLRTASEVDM